MKGKFCCFLLIICALSVKSRPLAPSSHSLQSKLSTNEMRIEGQGQVNIEAEQHSTSISNEERKMIGSSPPSCEHKCYGCMPCEAIQVPANTGRIGVQYTNYEPEGWKCKCGPVFYAP